MKGFFRVFPDSRLLVPLSQAQSASQQHGRHSFVQRVVVVAALGRLYAGGTAILAGTLLEHLQRCPPELLYNLISLFRNANTSRVAIVDEDLRLARVRVKRRGYAAYVVAVAEGEQRQYANGGVLGGVKPSR